MRTFPHPLSSLAHPADPTLVTPASCKKCKGTCLRKEKHRLELLVERGMLPGSKIVLSEHGDETPDSTAPGDLEFVLSLAPHPTFTLPDPLPSPSSSRGADIHTRLSLTLAESLLGFSRLICVHLDGRGLRVSQPAPGEKGWQVLKPGMKVVVKHEGMWPRRGGQEMRGDLVCEIEVEYPGTQWARGMEKGEVEALANMLGGKRGDVEFKGELDEVDLKVWSGPSSEGGRRSATEEDEYGYEYEEGEREQPGCAQQ